MIYSYEDVLSPSPEDFALWESWNCPSGETEEDETLSIGNLLDSWTLTFEEAKCYFSSETKEKSDIMKCAPTMEPEDLTFPGSLWESWTYDEDICMMTKFDRMWNQAADGIIPIEMLANFCQRMLDVWPNGIFGASGHFQIDEMAPRTHHEVLARKTRMVLELEDSELLGASEDRVLGNSWDQLYKDKDGKFVEGKKYKPLQEQAIPILRVQLKEESWFPCY